MRNAILACCGILALAGTSFAADAPAGSESFPMTKGQVYEIIGDSIGGPHEIYPLIQAAYKDRDLWYLNASFGGNTMRDVLGRLDRDAIRTDLGPDRDVNWYITMLGANDAALFKPEEFEANVRRMIETLKRRVHAHVILVATPCFTQGAGKNANKKLEAFAEVIKKLGAEYGIATVDLFHPCLDWAAKNGEATFSKDGIHPSPEAHKFMAESFFKQLYWDAPETIEVDLAAGTAKGSAGCDVELEKAGGAAAASHMGRFLTLTNRWDFGRKVALVLRGADKLDLRDVNGAKFEIRDGRAVVELPEPSSLMTSDLDAILKDAAAPADAKRIATTIAREIKGARTLSLLLVPESLRFPGFKREGATDLFHEAVLLADADKAAGRGQRFLGQFTDLRLNYPRQRLPRAQGYAGRDTYGNTRTGDAAAKPDERFEAAFFNQGALVLSGEIRIASIPKGWTAKPVGPATFEHITPGGRFTVEFELTGDETCAFAGEMVVEASFKLADKPQPPRQVVVKLFSPWLGIGTFSDTKERETASVKEKFDVAYPPEKGVDPKAACKRFDGKEVRWVPFRSFYSHPGVERSGQSQWAANGMFGGKDPIFVPWQPPAVYYIAGWVFSPDDRDVKLFPVFTSRAAKVWLNGALVIDTINPDEKAWNETAFGMNWTAWSKTDYYTRKTVDAKLKKGWNPLLFKFVSSARAWNDADMFNLSILDAAGKPFTDLLGSCVPPKD